MGQSVAAGSRYREAGNHRIQCCLETTGAPVAVYDFAVEQRGPRRILVLKLDHRGDLLIGLPALAQLRATFPDDHITLICSSWNAVTAHDLGVADEIRTFDYFPERTQNWDGKTVESIDRFREIAAGRFDIALDLRVDEDTRHLLRYVDTALRCGIGSRARHPFLDIVLPGEFENREQRVIDSTELIFPPSAFHSRMPMRSQFFHETDFSVTDAHLIFGPYAQLPLGQLRAEFAIEFSAPLQRFAKFELVVEVARGPDIVALKRLRRVVDAKPQVLELLFQNTDLGSRYEFRLFTGGRPRGARLRFYGVRVERVKSEPLLAPSMSAELHIGEQLSLLVRLIADRVRPLYPPQLLDRISNGLGASTALAGIPDLSSKCIVISPLSNKTARDWPLDRYKRLIDMLLTEVDWHVVIIGSADQASELAALCADYAGDLRLTNLAGSTEWHDVAALLRRADLVIANNSGVAHLAAACGRPTLAIYSGTHQPQEWGPRGNSARALMAVVPCSPCGYDTLELCSHKYLCMHLIEPETVFRHAVEMLSAAASRKKAELQPVSGA